MKSRVLHQFARLVAGLAAAALVVAGLVFVNLDRIARRVLIAALERQTGTGVRLDSVHLATRDSSLRLENLILSNPPGFTPRPLLSVPELYLAYDPDAAQSNALRFREVRLHLSELRLEVDRDGNTNLMALAIRAGKERGIETTNFNPLGTLSFQGIDRLTLTLGHVHFTDERDSHRNRTFELGITNRSLFHVQSLSQLLPLAIEIALKGGLTATPATIP